MLVDKETGKPIFEDSESVNKEGKKVSEEEMRKMSAFRDFIDTLDWEDFDKRKS